MNCRMIGSCEIGVCALGYVDIPELFISQNAISGKTHFTKDLFFTIRKHKYALNCMVRGFFHG